MIDKLITNTELYQFEKKYKALLISDVYLIDKVIAYLCKKKGKFLRPALAINVAKCMNGKVNKENYLVGSLVEMIHLATLIHDDIVDESQLRRGWPTIGRVWKNKISLLIGDYIFSRALSTIVKLDDLESIKILSKTSDALSKGEIFQIQESRKNVMTEKNYYAMIKDKTASLFSAACELSARASSSNFKDFENFKNFGECFGMAYQIKDDVNDILGTKKLLGKPVSLDLKRNTLTLPYIHCIDKLDNRDKKNFLRDIRRLSKKNRKKDVIKLVNEFDGIEYSNKKIKDYIDRGLSFLNDYPNAHFLNNVVGRVFYD